MLSINLVSIDHYQQKPLPYITQMKSQFDQSLFTIPVIRIFGKTNRGQSACLHVHQVYPYFYIQYKGSTNSDEDLNDYISTLEQSITKALSHLLESNFTPTIIMSIILVKGIQYYGYHSQYELFLKIYLLNPFLMNKVVGLLQSGSIMNTEFQVFEAHIPYLLQFLVDYNLYGMENVDLSYYKYRSSSDETENIWKSKDLKRQSNCKVEIDTWASAITNRNLVQERSQTPLANSFSSHQTQHGGTLIPSLAAIAKDEASRRLKLGMDQYSQEIDSNSQRFETIKWLNEDRLKTIFDQRIKECIPLIPQKSVIQKIGYDKVPTMYFYPNLVLKLFVRYILNQWQVN
jgi:DNA polymerase zeta